MRRSTCFQCVARDNPSDDRLIAFAQIRDLTELREHDGRLVALPTAEDAIATCLDSIRRAQSQRTAANRFPHQRIVVYVWPVTEVGFTELPAGGAHAADHRGRRPGGDPVHRPAP